MVRMGCYGAAANIVIVLSDRKYTHTHTYALTPRCPFFLYALPPAYYKNCCSLISLIFVLIIPDVSIQRESVYSRPAHGLDDPGSLGCKCGLSQLSMPLAHVSLTHGDGCGETHVFFPYSRLPPSPHRFYLSYLTDPVQWISGHVD